MAKGPPAFQLIRGSSGFSVGNTVPLTLRLSKGDLAELIETTQPNLPASALPFSSDSNL
jgi:hypothetical protein